MLASPKHDLCKTHLRRWRDSDEPDLKYWDGNTDVSLISAQNRALAAAEKARHIPADMLTRVSCADCGQTLMAGIHYGSVKKLYADWRHDCNEPADSRHIAPTLDLDTYLAGMS